MKVALKEERFFFFFFWCTAIYTSANLWQFIIIKLTFSFFFLLAVDLYTSKFPFASMPPYRMRTLFVQKVHNQVKKTWNHLNKWIYKATIWVIAISFCMSLPWLHWRLAIGARASIKALVVACSNTSLGCIGWRLLISVNSKLLRVLWCRLYNYLLIHSLLCDCVVFYISDCHCRVKFSYCWTYNVFAYIKNWNGKRQVDMSLYAIYVS